MKYDVIVVGAGILGLSSAFYLQKNNPKLKILVLEKEGDVAQGSTAKAVGMFRNTFSSKTNWILADTSINFYIALQKEGYDINLKLDRYLWLLSEAQFKSSLHLINSMAASGIEVKILEKDELKKIPGINLEVEGDEEAQLMQLENIHKGLLGLKCGSLDQYLLAKFYKEQFEKLGGEIRFNTKAEGLIITPERKLGIPREPLVWQKSKVGGVLTEEGEIYADRIVVAAGALANELLDPIGIDSHMKPKKRQLFQLQGPALGELLNLEGFNDEGTIPFTILPKSGIYIRPMKTERCFWVGCADDLGRPFNLDTTPEEEFYQYHVYPVLSKYFPQFLNLRVKNAWAGLYAYNTIDGIPYVFERYGAIVVTGCSGSGIMKADALGRIVDGLYRGEEFVKLYGDVKFRVSDLGVERRNVEREEFLI